MGEEDAAAVAFFVVLLQQCIVTKNPVRAFGSAELELDKLGRTEMKLALVGAREVAREGVTPGELEQLRFADSVAGAVAIAVCAFESAPLRFDEVLRVAVNHSGNSALSGALCGALLGGSFEGVEVGRAHWLTGLTGGTCCIR